MRKRRTAYVVLALLALVLSLVPAAIYPDVIVPMDDNWENWYWKGQPHPRPEFTLDHAPALFRAEMAVFKALVVPVGIVHRVFSGVPTAYATLWVRPSIETAGLPPLAHALQHVGWSVPTYFGVLALCYELVRLVARRMRRRT